ncbi:MAG: hypothetical protein P8010_00530 [Desulfosarcinaceae bacterium]|jgi:hypothetical protein
MDRIEIEADGRKVEISHPDKLLKTIARRSGGHAHRLAGTGG